MLALQSVLELPLQEIKDTVKSYCNATMVERKEPQMMRRSGSLFHEMVFFYTEYENGERMQLYATISKNHAAIHFYRLMQEWTTQPRDADFIREDLNTANVQQHVSQDWMKDPDLLAFGGPIRQDPLVTKAMANNVDVKNTIADFVRKYIGCKKDGMF